MSGEQESKQRLKAAESRCFNAHIFSLVHCQSQALRPSLQRTELYQYKSFMSMQLDQGNCAGGAVAAAFIRRRIKLLVRFILVFTGWDEHSCVGRGASAQEPLGRGAVLDAVTWQWWSHGREATIGLQSVWKQRIRKMHVNLHWLSELSPPGPACPQALVVGMMALQVHMSGPELVPGKSVPDFPGILMKTEVGTKCCKSFNDLTMTVLWANQY